MPSMAEVHDPSSLVGLSIGSWERGSAMLRFSDGEDFDTGGELRIEARRDGLYVLGGGLMIPVDSRKEGEDVIHYLTERKTKPE
jgi:hypothetical protein